MRYFNELEDSILRRLAAVDLTSLSIDQAEVEASLEKYLRIMRLDRHPITWAADGLQAQALVAQSELATVKQELRDSVERGSGFPLEKDWIASSDNAKRAGHGEQLEIVKTLMRGQPVRLSIPWRLYEGVLTGDRGARTSPEYSLTWTTAHDVLEYSARAAAECRLAQKMSWSKTYKSREDVWLPFVAAYEAGLWLFWITTEEIIALSRPRLRLRFGQLHSDDGPAVNWPGGEEQYFFLNGVHVPRELVELSANEIDPRMLLHERNTEVRREIVRKVGIERVCEGLNAECVDRAGNYELLMLDLQDGRMRPFLKMKNPSVGVYHIEGVAPECRTVAEALAWRNQSDVPPSVLT